MRRVKSVVLGVAVALGVGVTSVHAQWPVGKGSYWAKLSLYRHETREEFGPDGEKRPYFAANAESRSTAVFVDATLGLTDRLDIWAQVPYFDLNFDDDTGLRHSEGVSDIRISLRYNLFQLRQRSLPISVRFTTKIPVVDFPIDAEVVPVGEGQWDYEAWLEAGVSLYPLPAYAVLWLGRRWRTLNQETTRDPGDEFLLLAEFGVTSVVGRLGGKVVVDGNIAETGSIQGQAVNFDQREILYLAPGLTYQVTPSIILETAIRIPLRGKNFPAGNQFVIGLFHRGTLWN